MHQTVVRAHPEDSRLVRRLSKGEDGAIVLDPRRIFVAVEFWFDLQEAVEEPRGYSYNSPNSSYPSTYLPGVMRAEGRISAEVIESLEAV